MRRDDITEGQRWSCMAGDAEVVEVIDTHVHVHWLEGQRLPAMVPVKDFIANFTLRA